MTVFRHTPNSFRNWVGTGADNFVYNALQHPCGKAWLQNWDNGNVINIVNYLASRDGPVTVEGPANNTAYIYLGPNCIAFINGRPPPAQLVGSNTSNAGDPL